MDSISNQIKLQSSNNIHCATIETTPFIYLDVHNIISTVEMQTMINKIINNDVTYLHKIFDVRTCIFIKGKLCTETCKFINGKIKFPKDKLEKMSEFDLNPSIIDIKFCKFINNE